MTPEEMSLDWPYTIREWVEAPGVRFEPVDWELALLPALRIPAQSRRLGECAGMSLGLQGRTQVRTFKSL